MAQTEAETAILSAQERLANACLRLPMNPQNAGITAFVNVSLLSAQVSALVEYTAPFELDDGGSPIMKATYEELLLKHLTQRSELIENTAKEKPRIISG